MAQGQGLPSRTLQQAGGCVRDVTAEAVRSRLTECDLPADPHLADRLRDVLHRRAIFVDVTPQAATGDERALERIERAAAALVAAVGSYSGMADLWLAIDTDRQPGRDSATEFYGIAYRLAEVRARYFQPARPTIGYHAGIAEIRDLISEAGGNVALHETSRFVRFLTAIEADFPHLIFPPETAATPRGRYRYVQRALAK